MLTKQHIAYEAIISNVDLLLEEGHTVTIERQDTRHDGEDTWIYHIIIRKGGNIVAAGLGYPLSEAIADAYQITPEAR